MVIFAKRKLIHLFERHFCRALTICSFIYYETADDYCVPSISDRDLLATLLQGGFLDTLQKLDIQQVWESNVHLFEHYLPNNVIQKLTIDECYRHFDFQTDFKRLFTCYAQLTDLRLTVCDLKPCELNSELANELRTRFQQLRSFKLDAAIRGSAWPLLQQMVT